MKRVVEKVKDIVEICPFTHLQDFAADPGLTLAGYHFTDITADLMSKWIDRVVAVRAGQGGAYALAGFRGVGKSHFLSVLAAIVARPELRSRISDPHVESSAERLSRRHGPVAFVRRGSDASLLDELKRSVAVILETNPAELNDSLYDLLLRASEQAGDVPLVLLIDTAMGRDAHVTRDDGAVLSEIAEAAKTLGIFVGVALDDDISGADGPNASISTSYNIDYLDQEHLYKIVDSVIFTKHNQKRAVLHEIYEDYRSEMPGFRWSEHRFTSLYPLHPATVEVAPLIRLYIQDFGLLGFAADAGIKIMGRPANSLIGVDEIFDSVEAKLRQVPELAEAFGSFERIEREVIAKIAVQFRHPAKLILKGLLILSLNGDGASADEIAASMLISGSDAPAGQSFDIPALLDSFAEALPASMGRVSRDGGPPKYSFRLTSKLEVEDVFAEAVKSVSNEDLWRVLLAQTAEKYADFDATADVTLCNVEWRGAIRRGELIWPPSDDAELPARDRKELPDWTVRVEPDTDDADPAKEAATIAWRLARLTADEKDAIGRYFLLHNDVAVREHLGEGLSKAMHVHSMSVEKIWQRIFLQDSYLTAGGLVFKFTEDARAAFGLAPMMTAMLAPIFEGQFPAHPEFSEHLGHKEAGGLIANFFGGAEANSLEYQKLAECFAFPLGLAVKTAGVFVPTAADDLAKLEIVRAGFAGADPEAMVPLKDVAMRLQAPPVGLTREAQHLTLAALVAQKQYEFVTSSGNRINHRSLDLQIIWDDIVGVAKPLSEFYSPERLLTWAKIITGNAGLKSIDRSEDRLLIVDSLSGWLAGWNESRTLQEFDALPDEHLNAGIWRTAANLRKSFGAMADIIALLGKNDLSLDKCLQGIADLFSDAETEFENKKGDLRVLRDFTAGVSRRSEIATYLSLCEDTGDVELEHSRQSLIATIGSGQFVAAGTGKEKLDSDWNNFREQYARNYAEKHDAVMNSAASGDKLRDIVRSDEWAVFESFSSVEWMESEHFARAKNQIREMRQLFCNAKVHGALVTKPFCGCSFSLAETDRLVALPAQLRSTVATGLDRFRTQLIENAQRLIESADSDAMSTSVKTILKAIGEADAFAKLSSQDIRILKIAADRMGDIGSRSTVKESREDNFSKGIPDDMHLWEQEVQKVENFVNTEI